MVDNDRTSRYSRIVTVNLNKKYSVALYPNPAKDELFIDGIGYYQKVQITDANGKVIMTQNVKPGMYSINISTLKAGTYVVTLSGNDDTQSLKFVKLD